MTLYFIRHGETDWNVKKKIQGKTDIPLNENGLKQARELAQMLAAKKKREGLHVVRAYTSPQLRAAKTAKEAADALEIPCIALDGLREMDLGEWEGKNWDYIERHYGETYYYWNSHRRYTKTPHGECYDDVLMRTLKSLQYILEREDNNVLVVTHSAVMMALRCYLADCPMEEMVARFKAKNAEMVAISAEDIESAIRRYAMEKGETNSH